MAVFRLQSSIGDPSFAEVFIAQGGLTELRSLALHSNGNTLAYALTSFSRLLELDKGWDHVTPELISRVRCLRRNHRLGFDPLCRRWTQQTESWQFAHMLGVLYRLSNSSSLIRSSTYSAAPCRFSSPSSRTRILRTPHVVLTPGHSDSEH